MTGSGEDVPRPALATLTHERFYEPGWIYERKLDGERCLAVHDGDGVRLFSRSGRDVSGSFPEVVEALTGQSPVGVVLDGEVVAFDGGRTSFARLQPRIQISEPERARASGVAVHLYVFDILQCDGDDVTGRPLRERKRLLREEVEFADPVRYVPHRVSADEDYHRQICSRGWEGLIAKRVDAPYRSGRTKDWLKFTCEAGQEFVIVGYTDPEGSRVGFGALLLGYHDEGDLAYAGKVGTGFTDGVLRDLHERLSGMEISTSPCTIGRVPRSGVHWVRPELVGEVAFTEWTPAGQLRHPRFLGLRRDKDPDQVVREG